MTDWCDFMTLIPSYAGWVGPGWRGASQAPSTNTVISSTSGGVEMYRNLFTLCIPASPGMLENVLRRMSLIGARMILMKSCGF